SPNAASGVQLLWDPAGNRVYASTTTNSGATTHTEFYKYTNDGYLASVDIGDISGGNLTAAADPGYAQVVDVRDAMGRVTAYWEYQSNGSTVAYHRYGITYDADSNLT